MREHDHILASMDPIPPVQPEDSISPHPPAFLYRKFRTGRETWEILPRLMAEWTIATIPEREPNVARARLCLTIPKGIDQETEDRMQMALMFWLAERKENEDETG